MEIHQNDILNKLLYLHLCLLLCHHQKRETYYLDQFELVQPEGAFYIFPKAPWGTGTEFVTKAIENNLLIIPGNIFSNADTHFRISYAASDEVIDRGIEVLRHLAANPE